MKNLVDILIAIAVICVAISYPASIAVRRTVIPWRKRLKADGTRIEPARTIDVQIGPIHIIDKPADQTERTTT